MTIAVIGASAAAPKIAAIATRPYAAGVVDHAAERVAEHRSGEQRRREHAAAAARRERHRRRERLERSEREGAAESDVAVEDVLHRHVPDAEDLRDERSERADDRESREPFH